MRSAEHVCREADLVDLDRARWAPSDVTIEPSPCPGCEGLFEVLGHQFGRVLVGHVADVADPVAQLVETAHLTIVAHVDQECETARQWQPSGPTRATQLSVRGWRRRVPFTRAMLEAHIGGTEPATDAAALVTEEFGVGDAVATTWDTRSHDVIVS